MNTKHLQKFISLCLLFSYCSPGNSFASAKNRNLEILNRSTINTKAASPSLKTVPNQVILNSNNYQEIIPSQSVFISFSAFAGNSELGSFGTPVWNLSNTHVALSSMTSSGAWITGSTAGSTSISVTIDGVQSQEITVNVLSFSANNIVTQKGNFVGSSRVKYCHFINQSAGNSFYFSNYSEEFVVASSTGVGSSSSVGLCERADIQLNDSSITFKSSNLANTVNYSYDKTIGNKFWGRNKFVYLPESSEITFEGLHNSFLSWNSDISITYWTKLGANGDLVWPLFDTAYEIVKESVGDGGMFRITGAGGSPSYLALPKGEDFKDRWANVALSFNATTKLLKVYIDGTLVGQAILDAPKTSYSGQIKLGAVGGESSVDEVRFWRKELSASEVLNELFTPAVLTTTWLDASYSFDQSSSMWMNADDESSLFFEFNTVPSPYFVDSRVNLITETAAASTNYNFEKAIPYGEYGINKVGAYIRATDLVTPQAISIDVSSCENGGCVAEEVHNLLKVNRISPFFSVKALKGFTGKVLLMIPIDSQMLNVEQLENLKVYAATNKLNDLQELSILDPEETNLELGFITVEVNGGGTYWISAAE